MHIWVHFCDISSDLQVVTNCINNVCCEHVVFWFGFLPFLHKYQHQLFILENYITHSLTVSIFSGKNCLYKNHRTENQCAESMCI